MTDFIRFPFAATGDKTAVPDDVQPDGTVSFSQGYGADYAAELGVDPAALPIERDKFNYLMNRITNAIRQYQIYSAPDFIPSSDNGGVALSYSMHTRVRYDDGTGYAVYRSLVDSNTSLPTDNTKWLKEGLSDGYIRLQSNLSVYVSPSGSDSNSGLDVSHPFQTIQHAWDFVMSNYNLNGYVVTIKLADGTYTTGLNASGIMTGQRGPEGVVVQGNTSTPANVIINPTSADCFYSSGSQYTLDSMKLQTTTSGGGIRPVGSGSIIKYKNIAFGSMGSTGSHIAATSGGSAICSGNCSIVGGAYAHFQATSGASISFEGYTLTLTGTPVFAYTFASAYTLGSIYASGSTFSGSAAGSRYQISGNGVVYTNGSGSNYFPGDSAGSTSTGGQYI